MSTYIVSTLNDYGSGSFRKGIEFANKNSGTKIIFDISGKIILKSNLPSIIKPTDIKSNLSNNNIPSITIDGDKKYSVIKIDNTFDCVIDGLCIINSSCSGIDIYKSKSNKIYNCWIGIGTDGNKLSNNCSGIKISYSESNIIGTNEQNVQDYFSNIISGNNEHGIFIFHSKFNNIQNNIIGLNNLCNYIVANKLDGIKIQYGEFNTIGGKIFIDNNFNVNNPTGNKGTEEPVFVRPLLGNIISGNNKNGININLSSRNDIYGNFIGSDNTGLIQFGNKKNGIYIDSSEFTNILGAAFTNNPFVYYNVIGGNNYCGIYINKSKYTLVQANFIGIGADNSTQLANYFGICNSNSKGTMVGGVIPLGNVVAGNISDGFYITNKSSNFSSINTFCGLKAFGNALPNGGNGFLFDCDVTNIKLNTNVISGNANNGIMFTDNVSNILLTSNIIGLNTRGDTSLSNGGSGVVFEGNANTVNTGIQISSVIQKNIISGNLQYGIVLGGKSHDVNIIQTNIGLDYLGLKEISNGLGGLLITKIAYNNIVGTAIEYSNYNNFADKKNFAIKLTKNTHNNKVTNNFINIDTAGKETLHNYNIINESVNNIVYDNNLPYQIN